MKDIPSNWSFDVVGVAEQFDSHVREQLPWYDLVTRGVVHAARHYVAEDGEVWDVGASTGNVGIAMGAILNLRRARLFAVEKSRAMADRWRAPDGVFAKLIVEDARSVFGDVAGRADLIVAMLVLMFVPPRDRASLIFKMMNALRPAGALVIVDKALPVGGYPGAVMMRLALAEKLAAGAPPAEIVEKELSLAGVQRPLDPAILPSGAVEWFRFGDFAGWLIERPEA